MASVERQVAYKVRIGEILSGSFHAQEGWNPNYIQIRSLQVSRVNIIGVVILKPSDSEAGYKSITIDDGSGHIQLRSFDTVDPFERLRVGDILSVVGRPRIYGSQKYIQPELSITLVDNRWVLLRQKELELQRLDEGTQEVPPRIDTAVGAPSDRRIDSVLDVIRKSDNGDGADIEEVVTSIGDDATEDLITHMLEQGTIFETRPGKIKVLD